MRELDLTKTTHECVYCGTQYFNLAEALKCEDSHIAHYVKLVYQYRQCHGLPVEIHAYLQDTAQPVVYKRDDLH